MHGNEIKIPAHLSRELESFFSGKVAEQINGTNDNSGDDKNAQITNAHNLQGFQQAINLKIPEEVQDRLADVHNKTVHIEPPIRFPEYP